MSRWGGLLLLASRSVLQLSALAIIFASWGGRFDLQGEPDEIHGLSLLYSLRSMKSGRRYEVVFLPRSKVVLQAKLLPD